ncbi:hypothetical protein [uncultured Bradyrhizobium sp.]|uniref:hypothetical protein n=1 Tax=uncultured Bradyrhizobium sp. TaxID=199684 RepID=UPI0035C98705
MSKAVLNSRLQPELIDLGGGVAPVSLARPTRRVDRRFLRAHAEAPSITST